MYRPLAAAAAVGGAVAQPGWATDRYGGSTAAPEARERKRLGVLANAESCSASCSAGALARALARRGVQVPRAERQRDAAEAHLHPVRDHERAELVLHRGALAARGYHPGAG